MLSRKVDHRYISALLVGFVIMASPISTYALSQAEFKHEPPERDAIEHPERVILRTPAEGIERIRVLIEAEAGYRAVPMEREGAEYIANISFEDLAELTYHFQVDASDGPIFESQSYVLRKHSGQEFEQELQQKTAELEKLQAEVLQLVNTVQGLRVADPKALARQKNMELARAVVLLSKRERQVREAEAAIRNGQAELRK
ncbi:MAG: hypothetical protein K1X79_03855 [Oligoflexia bacterium]|nr:hypothetical protein [Oligoflexia bacterium]